jgi:hypothetical protein
MSYEAEAFFAIAGVSELGVCATRLSLPGGSIRRNGLSDIEPIKVHYFVPGRDEVVYKFMMRVRTAVHFC